MNTEVVKNLIELSDKSFDEAEKYAKNLWSSIEPRLAEKLSKRYEKDIERDVNYLMDKTRIKRFVRTRKHKIERCVHCRKTIKTEKECLIGRLKKRGLYFCDSECLSSFFTRIINTDLIKIFNSSLY